ncbi:hypothetical protein D3C73_1586900 [compost metagenome]
MIARYYGNRPMLESRRNGAIEQPYHIFRLGRSCYIHIMDGPTHNFIADTAADEIGLVSVFQQARKHLFPLMSHQGVCHFPKAHVP